MRTAITREMLLSAEHELFRALQSKYSLQYYLRVVYDVIQMPLTLCNTSFGLLAAVPLSVVPDTENVETVDGRQYIRFDITQEMDRKQHISRMMEDTHPYVSRDSRFPYEIAFQSVRINRAVVAYLFCPGCPEGFSAEDLELIDYLAQIVSIEMQKNESFEVESGLKYEYFLQELADGHFSSDEYAERRLRQLKRKPQPFYYILSFAFDDPESRHAANSYYYNQLLSIFPECLAGTISGRPCLLLPRAAPMPFSDRESQLLLKFLEFNRMRCGISQYYTSLVTSAYAMEQAAMATELPSGCRRLYDYADEYLQHLFSQLKNHDCCRRRFLPISGNYSCTTSGITRSTCPRSAPISTARETLPRPQKRCTFTRAHSFTA